jgi:hypothetical protein
MVTGDPQKTSSVPVVPVVPGVFERDPRATFSQLLGLSIDSANERSASFLFLSGNNGNNGNYVVSQSVIRSRSPVRVAVQTGTTGTGGSVEFIYCRIEKRQQISHFGHLDAQQ